MHHFFLGFEIYTDYNYNKSNEALDLAFIPRALSHICLYFNTLQ